MLWGQTTPDVFLSGIIEALMLPSENIFKTTIVNVITQKVEPEMLELVKVLQMLSLLLLSSRFFLRKLRPFSSF